MRALFSSPVSKLSIWMTVGMLGAALLGLPMTAVAQEAASNSTNVEAYHSSHHKIYVNYTAWKVEYAENGRNGDYHPVPWMFYPDGTVRSGNLWQGKWQIETNDTIRVSIIMNGSGVTDTFLVKFKNSSKFTAYKNGSPYRYGVRQ